MRRSAIGLWLILAVGGFSPTSPIEAAYAKSAPAEAGRLLSALDQQTTWLATSPQGPGWSSFLHVKQLRAQVAADNPDRSVVEQVLQKYRSAQPGLDSPVFVAVRTSLERWLAELPIAEPQLLALVQASKDKFVQPQPADEAAARAALATASTQFDTYLATQGANGAKWGSFLKVDELRAQLSAPTTNVDRLKEVAQAFSSGHFGLQLAPFDQVRIALNNYLRVTSSLGNTEGGTQYAADVDRLAALLEQYQAQPTAEAAEEMGAILGRLSASGQAPQVVSAVRRSYARPNVFVAVSEGFLARGFAERVDESEPVHEMIEGTRIRGTAHTVGDVTLALVPNTEQAVLQALFAGQTYTKTVGTNGPARIYSSGTTQLTGQQVLYIDADGLHALSSTSQAKTAIRTNGIGTTSDGIRGCIVERVATKRVAAAKPGAERTTSSKAETRLNGRLAERVNKFVGEANDRYWKQIRQPLTEKNQFPEDFLIRTTPQELLVTGVAASSDQLGASAAPPDLTGDPDLAIRLHETAVNNFAQGVLAGETLHSDRVREEMIEIMGELPDRFEDEEGKAPWSITFADQKPVEVKFEEGSFTVTIRGKQYTSDDRTYRAMNVTAIYKIESTPDGLKGIRQGDLQIFPPGFVPGQRRFSVPEQTLRSILERRFNKLFTAEIGGEALEPPGRFKNLGKLEMSNFASQAGWITLGWRPLAPSATAVTSAR